MRKLATIEEILEIHPIAGADKIEVAKVRGWNVVVKKDEFQVGDRGVFFEIDSLLPRADWNLFLQKDKGTSPIRLKTVKLRGQISQGLVLPISTFPNLMKPFHEGDGVIREFRIGDDVSEILGVTKWEPPEVSGNSPPKGSFPHYLRKTDEERLQNCLSILEVLHGIQCAVTVKFDGQSGTYFHHNGETGVCSRNLLLKDPVEGEIRSTYWKMEEKYDILNKLKSSGRNLQISGEVYGEGIQKNRLGISGIDFAMFTLFDIDNQVYLGHDEVVNFSREFDIPMVTVLTDILTINKDVHTLDYFLAKAEEYTYPNGHPIEGIVVRPIKEMSHPKLGRISFKVISNKFLLMTGE